MPDEVACRLADRLGQLWAGGGESQVRAGCPSAKSRCESWWKTRENCCWRGATHRAVGTELCEHQTAKRPPRPMKSRSRESMSGATACGWASVVTESEKLKRRDKAKERRKRASRAQSAITKRKPLAAMKPSADGAYKGIQESSHILRSGPEAPLRAGDARRL